MVRDITIRGKATRGFGIENMQKIPERFGLVVYLEVEVRWRWDLWADVGFYGLGLELGFGVEIGYGYRLEFGIGSGI